MPKSSSRDRQPHAPSPEARGRWGGSPRVRRLALWGGIALLAAAGGGLWWQSRTLESKFLDLAAAGRGALTRVESPTDRGAGHLSPGQSTSYPDRFPTSGVHTPDWVTPRFYAEPQSPPMLVHALEHGNVVIYYDRPGDVALSALRAWAGLYDDQWGGVIAIPAPGLGPAVVLTAWRNRLRLEAFDAAAAAAFVDAYRGRGPEHPIR